MQRPMEPTILLYLVEMYGHGIHHSPRNRIDRTAETETTRSTSLQKNLYLSPSASRFGSAKRASYLSISIFFIPNNDITNEWILKVWLFEVRRVSQLLRPGSCHFSPESPARRKQRRHHLQQHIGARMMMNTMGCLATIVLFDTP